MSDFQKADEKVHKVESQWHYPIMIKYGFEAVTKKACGFVRAYEYQRAGDRVIRCNTGVSADYWTDLESKKTGYWSDLEPYLKSLAPHALTCVLSEKYIESK